MKLVDIVDEKVHSRLFYKELSEKRLAEASPMKPSFLPIYFPTMDNKPTHMNG